MKKWKCSLCGYLYDPEKENPPGEAAGAAKCGYNIKGAKKAGTPTCVKCGGVMEVPGDKQCCRKGCN